jgi:hypothetical protein
LVPGVLRAIRIRSAALLAVANKFPQGAAGCQDGNGISLTQRAFRRELRAADQIQLEEARRHNRQAIGLGTMAAFGPACVRTEYHVPSRYAVPETSGVTAEVSAQQRQFSFALSTARADPNLKRMQLTGHRGHRCRQWSSRPE